MGRQMTASDSVTIDVSPATAYEAVSDVTQMGRWSPENTGAQAPDGPLAVGTSFVGRNRRGRYQWATQCTVTAADPGRRFAFRVHRFGLRRPVLPVRIATWEYRFEDVDDGVLGSHAPRGRCDGVGPTFRVGASKGGTRVTETWTDDRPWPDPIAAAFDKVATGGHTFAKFQQGNIRRTLDRLRSELERG